MKNFVFVALMLLTSISFAQQDMPNVDLKTLDNKTISVGELTKDDTVKIFAFWATWCVPCINELDAIAEVYEDWQDETNVELIAVSIDDTRTKKRIKPLVNGKGWDYKILIDDNQELKRGLNISSVPFVVVTKNGKIVYKHNGYTPGAEDELLEQVKKHSK